MSGFKSLEWEHLGPVTPQTRDLSVRKASPDWSDEILIAVDAYGHRHLLILVEDDAAPLADKDSRGVKVELKELRDQSNATALYIDIECLDPSGHAALDMVAAEIAAALEAGSSIRKVDLVANIVGKWRRFWSSPIKKVLSKDEQIGLFGELWFLVSWLIPTVGAGSVFAWRGPNGSRHDFELPGASVEVKATLLPTPRHRINGIRQLAESETGPLYLFSIQLREEGGATNCVPSLVSACRRRLQTFPEQLSHFEEILYRAGYMDVAGADYSKLKLRVIEQGVFLVAGRFPRLVPASFPEGLPDGVGKVSYEIDLTGFADCLLGRTPETVAIKLQPFAGEAAGA